MKKQLLTRTFSLTMFMSCLILFIISCKKDRSEAIQNSITSSNSIASARESFENQSKTIQPNYAGQSFLSKDLLKNRTLAWNRAFSQSNGDTVAVFVPVNIPSRITLVEGGVAGTSLNDLLYLRLMTTTNGFDGSKAEMISLIPDKVWQQNNSFSGNMLVENWFEPNAYVVSMTKNSITPTKVSGNHSGDKEVNFQSQCFSTSITTCVQVGDGETCSTNTSTYCANGGGGGSGGSGGGGGRPGGGGGGGGGGSVSVPGNKSKPKIEIIKDIELTTKYPCVAKKILTNLESNNKYNALVEPFLAKGLKPNLTWSISEQPWGETNSSRNYSGAFTRVNSASNTGMSSDIKLNSKMLDGASELLISAVAIHETYHAYVNYMFANENRPDLLEKSSPSYMASFYEMSLYDNRLNVNTNYSDHYTMLTSQFDNMVDILYNANGGTYQVADCRKALLFGMDNPGDFPTNEQSVFINQAYNDLLAKYGLSKEVVDTFNSQSVKASDDNGWKKLGSDCK